MGDSGVFRGLIEARQVGRVTLAIEEAIAASFVADRSRITQAEVKRRFDICATVFKSLRADFHWSIDRALDHLPEYLRCELDGQPYDPASARTVWMPGDSAL